MQQRLTALGAGNGEEAVKFVGSSSGRNSADQAQAALVFAQQQAARYQDLARMGSGTFAIKDTGIISDARTWPANASGAPAKAKIGGRNIDTESDRHLGDKPFNDRVVIPDATIYAQRDYQQCVIEIDYSGRRNFSSRSAIKLFYTDTQGERESEIFEFDPTVFFSPETPLPEITSNQPSIQSRDPAQFSEKTYDGKLMEGCDYRRLTNVSQDACRMACAGSSQCQGYSYSKWTRSCHLKHTINDLRLDPEWITGAKPPAGEVTLRESIREKLLDPLYSKPRLTGPQLEMLRVTSTEKCAAACKMSDGCVGYSYAETTKTCRRFTSIQATSDTDEQADSAVWRQR